MLRYASIFRVHTFVIVPIPEHAFPLVILQGKRQELSVPTCVKSYSIGAISRITWKTKRFYINDTLSLSKVITCSCKHGKMSQHRWKHTLVSVVVVVALTITCMLFSFSVHVYICKVDYLLRWRRLWLCGGGEHRIRKLSCHIEPFITSLLHKSGTTTTTSTYNLICTHFTPCYKEDLLVVI